jgi:fructose-1,6-bisphosphatase/sedoheptulose 1,7-bisphosphatase-like protein
MERKRLPVSPWRQMISGMRAYGVAITVIWAMCACTVLVVLAVAVGGTWLHVGLGAGAALELGLSAATLRFLTRASVRGRLDV